MTDEEIKEYWRTAYCNEKHKKEELEKESHLLGERCNQLLKDKGDLTDQIADIKANCDLAIEGRDVKIKELELELTVQKDQLQEETNLHLHAEEYIKSLEQQIEKMKCCGNCTKGNCVNIGQKGKACAYWTSNELREIKENE